MIALGLKKNTFSPWYRLGMWGFGWLDQKQHQHLYWVPTSTPDGSPQLKLEKWISVYNHIQNIHEGHGAHFLQFQHGNLDLDPVTGRKRWLRTGIRLFHSFLPVTQIRIVLYIFISFEFKSFNSFFNCRHKGK